MIAENVHRVRERIARACHRAGRRPEEVTLIGVTKTFGTSVIRAALEAGVKDIGENYVQDLRAKRAELESEDIRWHFIGHLQSNKIKYIAPWIHCIQAVDSVALGRELSRWGERTGRALRVLVEVNTSGEAPKFGVRPEDAPALVKELAALPGLFLSGLMTMGPFSADSEDSRPAFRQLREVRDRLEADGIALPHLSMGMTGDFEVAIEEGSTMVRIGTALFGTRTTKKE